MSDQANLTPAKTTKLDGLDAIAAIIRKVDRDNPKPEDVNELRALLRRSETHWQVAGDLMERARRNAIDAMNWGKSKTVVRESMEEGMNRIRDQLGFAKAPMLERLLIEQVVTAWVRLSLCEIKYSHNMSGSSVGIPEADYWDRALSAAQRRYLRAIESLARVRRLKLPALQVNVAQADAKQLNVALAAAVAPDALHSADSRKSTLAK
jgi:hypothetical protein